MEAPAHGRGLFPRGEVPADDANVLGTLGKIVTSSTSELAVWLCRQELTRMDLAGRGGQAARNDVGQAVEAEKAVDTLSVEQLSTLLGRIVAEVDRHLAAL